MKKFFIGFFKGLAYLALYFGIMNLVQGIWAGVKCIPLGVKYAAMGADLMNPAVFEQYMQDLMQVIAEIAVPSTVVSNVVAIVVVCLIFVGRKQKLTEAFCLRKFHPGAVLPIVLMGLGFNVVTGMILGSLPEELLNSYEQASSALTTDVGVLTIIATVIMAPLAEELFLRGLVYTRMKKGMPVIAAMIISSVLFGMLHGHWIWAMYASVFGMLLAWTFERTKSLWACILLHFSYNLCAMLQMLIPETAPDFVGVIVLAVAVVFAAVGLFLFIKVPKAEEPVAETAETTATVAEEEPETL